MACSGYFENEKRSRKRFEFSNLSSCSSAGPGGVNTEVDGTLRHFLQLQGVQETGPAALSACFVVGCEQSKSGAGTTGNDCPKSRYFMGEIRRVSVFQLHLKGTWNATKACGFDSNSLGKEPSRPPLHSKPTHRFVTAFNGDERPTFGVRGAALRGGAVLWPQTADNLRAEPPSAKRSSRLCRLRCRGRPPLLLESLCRGRHQRAGMLQWKRPGVRRGAVATGAGVA
jgi:hypothetical protein